MHFLEGIALLLFTPLVCLLSGYWLVARLSALTPTERIAWSVLGGLGCVLLLVSALNYFHPLQGIYAWLCVSPCLISLAMGRELARDFLQMFSQRRTAVLVVAAGAIGYWALLLWPMLRIPGLVFYDGTSNHDSFFWIAAADHLKRNSYMEHSVFSQWRPLTNSVGAIIGLKPAWGRMGGEGLLALVSSLVGASPLKIFIYATAALFVPWMAAAYLFVKVFVREQLNLLVLVGLALTQPIFVFFHSNANLPNLIGALAGTALTTAIAQPLRRPGTAHALLCWVGLITLLLHAIVCSYPEMLPFALLPGALLWLRAWFVPGWAQARGAIAAVAGAVLLGFAINPISTLRGYHGFVASFATARANENWGNLFLPLIPAEYIPALTSLSVSASRQLGVALGVLLSGFLVVMLIATIRRARDPFGVWAALMGSTLLLGYTLATGFIYGWQKTVQFSGVTIGAIFPAGCLAVLPLFQAARSLFGRLVTLGSATALIVFYSYATLWPTLNTYGWAVTKSLTRDHLAVRANNGVDVRDKRVLVVPESFLMAFFHGMWATYFLPSSDLVFSGRGDEAGGYLRDGVVTHRPGEIPAPDAVLVSRAWADSIDANTEALFRSNSFALLRTTNFVTAWEGVYPNNGVPTIVASASSLSLLPHSESVLEIELQPRDPAENSTALTVTVSTHLPNEEPAVFAHVHTPPPWRFAIPLKQNVENRISFSVEAAAGSTEYPFKLAHLRVVSP